MKVKFELEYTLNSAPRVLFSRLSTPEGLSEWFADDVQVNGDIFSFYWDDVEHKAQLALLKDNRQVKFKWAEDEQDDEKYFEFRLNIDELTGDVALIITDHAEEGEKEDAVNLWDTQIAELRKVLGL
ncbi:MAG: START-like domain-containing protein [Bacteroidales bacterium]